MYVSVVTVRVSNVDRAIGFYTKKLGWQKTMDAPMGPDMRWVTVSPPGGQAAFFLSKSDKSGGDSGVIIEVNDVYQAHKELKAKGVEFSEPPRTEPWGSWALFKDSEGNAHGLHSPVRNTNKH
jgi:predicted enzyme related to lactoylglutathione lyase